jgi:soluble lytic murein transglycosylase-like protein
VLGVIKTESNFNPKAKNVNKNGSIDLGIMQINSCHEDLCKQLGVSNLYNPYQNIKVGVELLSNLYKKYKNVHYTLIAYNMGEGNLRKNLKVGRGTTIYSRKVTKNINIIVNSNEKVK